jgi:ribosomal protein L37AE/L43A
LDLNEWAAYRDKMNPQVVLASRIENKPLPYDYISLVARFDTKAARDVASCGTDAIERHCSHCGAVFLQRLSCGSWACPRCSDRRNGSNTDWLVFKINRVWDKLDKLEGFKHNRAFWKWEVTAPSGKYQYRISKRGMRHWKRFGYHWWREYLCSQKPEFRGLDLATYVYGQNWRSSDPLGVGTEAKKYGSAFHYHDHGYASPFGWHRSRSGFTFFAIPNMKCSSILMRSSRWPVFVCQIA